VPESDIEIAAREALAQVLNSGSRDSGTADSSTAATDLDLDADMANDLGLSSLNKVIFLMSACDDAQVSLSAFTESDVASMRTLRDVIAALAKNANGGS
jgi:hypothetical protein